MDLSSIFERVFPRKISFELKRLAKSRGEDFLSFSEIRLRAFGVSSATLSGERILLSSRCDAEELKKCFSLVCEGSPYAYRESIRGGYVTIDGGVRVGICGRVRYDDGESTCVSDVGSLVFRIPTSESELSGELISAWTSVVRGMLIYSPPGVGKTSALRSLVLSIGKGKRENVVVIDEREEFIKERYYGTSVDVMRGYKHAEGAAIALRMLAPDVIAIDELGGREECDTLFESANSGVKIIATAHAASYEEITKKRNLQPLISGGVFDTFFGISKIDGRRISRIEVINA